MTLTVWITSDVVGQPARKEVIMISSRTNPKTVPLPGIPEIHRPQIREHIKQLIGAGLQGPKGPRLPGEK